MFSRIEFVLTETFLSLRRHPMMAFAAITCAAATLFVAGLVALALLNANLAVNTVMNEVRFVVFFHQDPQTTREEARAAFERIKHLDGVASAQFETREQSWARMKREVPDYGKIANINYCHDSVTIKVANITAIPALKAQLLTWPEVQDVKDAPEVTSFVTTASRAVSRLGLIMGIVLVLLSLVIIHHTIELTLYARRREIQIMALVGATPTAVAAPFLLEGIIYGLLGGGLALLILIPLYELLASAALTDFGCRLLQDPMLLQRGVLAIFAAGIALGLIGSSISVVKYMHQPRSKVTNA